MTAVTERLDSPRILAGTAADIEVSVYQDGDLVDIAAAPAPACVLTNADTGATFVASPTVIEPTPGKLRISLTAAQTATPVRLRAEWSFTVEGGQAQVVVTYHEIAGDVLFTLSEARAFDHGALSSETAYPDIAVLTMRDRIAEAFEEITGVAFGTRATRSICDGDGSIALWLPSMRCQAVSAVAIRERGTTTWTSFTPDDLADLLLSPNGRLIRETLGSWSYGQRNIRVDYTHGWERVPLEVKRAALWVLRDHLAGNNLPRNALSQVDELGTFQLATPGQRGAWFGIPEVDEVLRRYSAKLPGIA
jgi:hypothetical protein